MEIRRVISFLLISMAVLFLWKAWVVDPAKKRAEEARLKAKEEQEESEEPTTDFDVPAVAEKPLKLEENPKNEEILLGSADPASPYFLQVKLTTTGAAVRDIWFNDDRYHSLVNPEEPLAIASSVSTATDTYRTFELSMEDVDETLRKGTGKGLNEVEWELVAHDESSCRFEFQLQGQLRIAKTYSLTKSEGSEAELVEQRISSADGYQLRLNVEVTNIGGQPQSVGYHLLGPVGFPLENPDTARKFRDVKFGFYDEGELDHDSLTVADLVEKIDEDDLDQWKKRFQYAGIDGQFFAALVIPEGREIPVKTKKEKRETVTQKKSDDYVDYYQGRLIDKAEEPQKSEVSVEFFTEQAELLPGEKLTDSWSLYAGPKRQGPLDQIQAAEVLEYGWFSWISKSMVWLLQFFHNNLFLPYGLAIIALTVLVRGAMFPLSKKQAVSALKMKELQPKLAELKKRYGNDKQKFAHAQMELFRKTGTNPLAGCLPVFLQMPIFIGLYWGLSAAVDLRAARFLWVDNLAAPDQLFKFPFKIPYIGWYFNLLPILTIGLFIAQQKLFMPPPAPDDDQARMQHKIMNFMMIFMGFLFYHVPAGLCVYFIASSLWGIAERKMLDVGKAKANPAIATAGAGDQATYVPLTASRDDRKNGNAASRKKGKKGKGKARGRR